MQTVLAWIRLHKVLVIGMLLVVLVGWNRSSGEDPGELADSRTRPEAVAPSEEPAAVEHDEDEQSEHADDETSETPAQARSKTPDRPSGSQASEKTTRPKPKVQPKREHQPQPKRRLYAVLDVIDGDTVKVDYRGGESVRIIGIDTPETVHPSEPVECWGPRASAAATRLLAGRRVALVFDPTQGRRDAFDRLLAFVTIPGTGDFGLAMVRRGHAIEYTYDTAYAKQGPYQRAETHARRAGRGLWGKCGGADTPLHQPEPKPEPKQAAPAGGNCDPGYDPCVPAYPPDVDCADVDGPIRVTGQDPHGLDGEGDGIACE